MKVSAVNLRSVEAMQVTTASTYCPVCGTWAADLVEVAKHKESMKHRRNRLFHVYQVWSKLVKTSFIFILDYYFSPHQHDKEKMLKNPHPLGLEVKIAEQEQVPAEINITILT